MPQKSQESSALGKQTNLIKLFLCITADYQGVLTGVLKAGWHLAGVLVDDVHSNYCTGALKVRLKIFMLDVCQELLLPSVSA